MLYINWLYVTACNISCRNLRYCCSNTNCSAASLFRTPVGTVVIFCNAVRSGKHHRCHGSSVTSRGIKTSEYRYSAAITECILI